MDVKKIAQFLSSNAITDKLRDELVKNPARVYEAIGLSTEEATLVHAALKQLPDVLGQEVDFTRSLNPSSCEGAICAM